MPLSDVVSSDVPVRFRPTDLEIASGVMLGPDDSAGVLPRDTQAKPIEALEDLIRSVLSKPPCFVSFSGGRDSSAVLALASNLARREGLELPVPVTMRFPHAPATDEGDWQEQVVRHLGIDDWVRLALEAELDCVGPVARDALARHGLFWPFNAHFLLPALREAKAGTLITGIFGDQVFSPSWLSRPASVLRGARPRRSDLYLMGLALSPRPLRRAILRHRNPLSFPWLTEEALREMADNWATSQAEHSLSWSRDLDWWWRRRQLHVGLWWLDRLAADMGSRVVHPFGEPEFLAALARKGRGYPNRNAVMETLFSRVLPEQVLHRQSKAEFGQVFFTETARQVVTELDSLYLDDRLVDLHVLRKMWLSNKHDGRTMSLLQAAWLFSIRSS